MRSLPGERQQQYHHHEERRQQQNDTVALIDNLNTVRALLSRTVPRKKVRANNNTLANAEEELARNVGRNTKHVPKKKIGLWGLHVRTSATEALGVWE